MQASDEIVSQTICKVVERFERERSRYLRLAERLAEICRVEIVEANAIRAQVTYRAKSAKSLEGKLRRIVRSAGGETGGAEELYAEVSDLAGVRVATFRTEDEGRVVEEIKRRFRGAGSGAVQVERKDRLTEDGFGFYRASHCQAFLLEEELAGPYEDLRDVFGEIQVCSMMAQVWNEIEHDIGYKPTGGGPQRVERSLLKALGHLTRSADEVISRLLEANADRLQEQTGEFQDVFDFVARLRGRFPGADLSRHGGPLFEELVALGVRSPEELKSQIGAENFDPVVAAEKLSEFNGFLIANNRLDLHLDEQSSDLLLVLLLERFAGRIVANHPTGRGKGRPPRIRSVAACYRDYTSA